MKKKKVQQKKIRKRKPEKSINKENKIRKGKIGIHNIKEK